MSTLAFICRPAPAQPASKADQRRLAAQAAEWMETLEGGKEEDRAAFVDWLQASAEHVSEFLRMCALTEDLQQLGKEGAISKTDPSALFGEVTDFYSLESKRVDEAERRLQKNWKQSIARSASRSRASDAGFSHRNDVAAQYERYRRPLLQIFLNRRIDASSAQDLLQQTFLQALVTIRSGEIKNPGTYLYTVARRQAAQYGRKNLCQRHEPDYEGAAQVPDPAISPEEEVELQQRATLVHRLLLLMTSSRDREVLDRFYLKEESRGELCRSLQLTELQFNQVLFRARKRFAELWQEELEGVGGADLVPSGTSVCGLQRICSRFQSE
jgi:RNA polymerase sigma-70 factor (ECF subfamily)